MYVFTNIGRFDWAPARDPAVPACRTNEVRARDKGIALPFASRDGRFLGRLLDRLKDSPLPAS